MSFPQGTRLSAFSYYPRLRKVKEHIEQHISEEISLGKAATVAGLEEKYFSAFFHAKTGICFKDWVAYLRVKRAKEFIESRNDSITDIALAVGFQELRTFERTFKKCTGVTAQAFKRSIRPS